MIAIHVELLTGRYVATSYNDRSVPEWPPHPARLFSALVATALEDEDLAARVRPALRWLEQQPPPTILASEAETRSPVRTYVPGNSGGVIGDWSAQEAEVDRVRAEVTAIEGGDAKSLRRARAALKKAEEKLHQQIARAIGKDEKPTDAACASAIRLLPSGRGKQPRHFPSVTPTLPWVRFLWPESNPAPATLAALEEVVTRVPRLGHSSSAVACRILSKEAVTDAQGVVTWRPDEQGAAVLRVVHDGQLERLELAFARHRGLEPRVLPADQQLYSREGQRRVDLPQSTFGVWFIFREISADEAPRRGVRLARTEDVGRALRGALLRHAPAGLPPVVTGHDTNGAPLKAPHAAFVTLADVAGRFASGTVLGAAIILPSTTSAVDRDTVLRAIGAWQRAGLRLGLARVEPLGLERVVDGDTRSTLDPRTWTQPARRWASVTPVALDENPGEMDSDDPERAARAAERAEQIVAMSCERIGLPRPIWVQTLRRSMFAAAPAARRFMPFPSGAERGPRRVCVHVELRFNEPVMGPVLLGAGRYFGLGLCRPWGVT